MDNEQESHVYCIIFIVLGVGWLFCLMWIIAVVPGEAQATVFNRIIFHMLWLVPLLMSGFIGVAAAVDPIGGGGRARRKGKR